MARKLKLSPEISFDCTAFGVACHMKDYRFTYFLNAKLGFKFKRVDDLKIVEDETERSYSFFLYKHPDERRNYYLISNFHESGRLIPQEKGVDFFIIAGDLLPTAQKKQLTTRIQEVSQVLAVYEIPLAKAKNLEVIFQEIEMHFLE
jgi:hypothetical protein